MIDSQPAFVEKQRLEKGIASTRAIKFELAFIRQDPSISIFEVAEKVLQCNVNILAQQLLSIDILVTMATEIKQKEYMNY